MMLVKGKGLPGFADASFELALVLYTAEMDARLGVSPKA
jgi:hypothetical protein